MSWKSYINLLVQKIGYMYPEHMVKEVYTKNSVFVFALIDYKLYNIERNGENPMEFLSSLLCNCYQ